MEHSILLFDGDCGFCTRSVQFLERWAPADVAREPWQFVDLAALGVSRARTEHEVVWVGTDGRVAGGAQAVAAYLIAAGGPWALLGRLMRVPPVRWLAAGVYRVIANNRYRLPGGTPACALRAGGSAPDHLDDRQDR